MSIETMGMDPEERAYFERLQAAQAAEPEPEMPEETAWEPEMRDEPEPPDEPALNERWTAIRETLDRANRLTYAANNFADRSWVEEMRVLIDAEERRVVEMEEILRAHGLEVPSGAEEAEEA